jgi:hypothetical protein
MTETHYAELRVRCGTVLVDVLADERGGGIDHRTIYACKTRRTNVSSELVQAFRIVFRNAGAARVV